jgi:hypothetical protein
MKMADAAIEWIPSWWSEGDAPHGSVRVARKEPGWFIWRACWLDIGNPLFWSGKKPPTETHRALQMFLDFHAMVVRDGVDPKVLHSEMLKIDEYRRYIANDIDGADVAA